MTPRISVALATYNGERYLEELLASLASQSLLPCELIACDDGSSDNTLVVLNAFAEHAPFPVRITTNPSRLGVEGNFSLAMTSCCGDYIALADQDDVWRDDKLMRLAQAFDSPDSVAAFSDAEVVSADLENLGYTMWERVDFTQEEQLCMSRGDGFAILLKHRVVTGATFACKARLLETALPIPAGWPHDAWLALVAASRGKLCAIPETLIAYRQHEDNVVGGRKKGIWQQAHCALRLDRNSWYNNELKLWNALLERIGVQSSSIALRTSLAEKITHLEVRAQLPRARWRRVPGVLREVASGRYARYARNWSSIAIDLLVR